MTAFLYFNILLSMVICYMSVLYVTTTSMMYQPQEKQIIVLLGCNNQEIQNQRIQSLFDYIDSTTAPFTLYLSGGSKDGNTESEASIMRNQIQKIYPNITIYVDMESTNTAENFINLHNWIQNKNEDKEEKIVITTSDFHKERAEKIFTGLVPNVTLEWNLSKSNCEWCWEAEPIHMKNVDTDIARALYVHHQI